LSVRATEDQHIDFRQIILMLAAVLNPRHHASMPSVAFTPLGMSPYQGATSVLGAASVLGTPH
jgi:hypothetical protein